jgi:hypothetical protein
MFRMFTPVAAFASLLAVTAAPSHAAITPNALSANALTNNALTNNALAANALIGNALTHNALTSTGSGLAELNGVAVEAVVLPRQAAT